MQTSLRGALDVNVGASGDALPAPQSGLASVCAGVERKGRRRKTSSNPHALIFKNTFADGICFLGVPEYQKKLVSFFLLASSPEEGNQPIIILHLCRLF